MKIHSTRFGLMEIRDDAVLTFPEGLIGIPGTRYALIAGAEESAFYWLHSVEDPDIALPVTTPWLFFADYEVRISDEDAHRLDLERPEQADILVVVSAAQELEEFSTNLVAPVIIHAEKRIGRQIINDAGGYLVRQPLFDEVDPEEVEPPSTSVPVAARAD